MKKLMMTLCVFMPVLALARLGTDQGNGGDACEKRIQEIRDDIASWISRGGSQDLKLPERLTLNDFNRGMLEQIDLAKITCNKQLLSVFNAEKTCVNTKDNKGRSYIQCHIQRFNNTSEADQYMLIHHEYAGLARFEVNQGTASNYEISKQVTGYLENQIVKRLTIKKVHSGEEE